MRTITFAVLFVFTSIGNFTHGHTIAVDSTGNIYVAETNWGRRVQRFKPVKGP